MTQEDVLEMARSSGVTDGMELQHEIDALMRFAELVVDAFCSEPPVKPTVIVKQPPSTTEIKISRWDSHAFLKWVEKNYLLYRDEIVEELSKRGAPLKIKTYFESHEMYRWYPIEITRAILKLNNGKSK